jgi:hypothetical protein
VLLLKLTSHPGVQPTMEIPGTDQKITVAVVALVSVDVMNGLVAGEWAAQSSLGD